MNKRFFNSIYWSFSLFLFSALPQLTAQTSVCAGARQVCGSLSFGANTTGPNGGTYNCLSTTPNQTWLYAIAGSNGTWSFPVQIAPSADIDFAAYGPFTSLSVACANISPSSQPLSCDYSTRNGGNITVPNVVAGQIYVFLVANFSRAAGTISLGSNTGTASVSCIPLCNTPTYTVTGGSNCSGGAAIPIGLAGSTSGVSYQVKLNGSNIGTPVSGTGGVLHLGSYSSLGTYTVTATQGSNCVPTLMPNSVTIANNTPTVYTVTGGGTICLGSAGIAIGLSNSQSNVTYQLQRNGTNVGTPIAGNNSTLSFGNQTVAGTYTVIGSRTGCSATMSGSQTITVSTSTMPTVSIAITTGNQQMCGTTATTFTATPINGGTTPVYSWRKNGSTVGTNSPTYTNAAWADGDVIQCLLTSNASCLTTLTATSPNITMSVNPVPTINVIGSTSGCGSVNLTASNNGALNFEGTTAAPTYVTIPDANSLDLTNAITLEAWVNPTASMGALRTIISKNRVSGGDGYYMGLNYSGSTATIGAGVAGTPQNIYATSTTAVPLNVWSHVAMTFNGSEIRLYLNGNLVGTTPGVAVTIANSTQPLCIGNAGAGLLDRSFQGEIDEVRVWNSVRTLAQIQAKKSRGIAAHPNLVAYYRFNEATGNIATDVSGNNNNGTWVGAIDRVHPSTATNDPSTFVWSTGANTAAAQFTTNGTYNVSVTDANGCNASHSVTTTVTPNVTPTATISASTGLTTCANTNVTFTATPTNAGTTPSFQWKKNDNNISGATNATYATNSLTNGDNITVVLTSNATCQTVSTVTPTPLAMTVNTVPTVASITGNNELTLGGSTTFSNATAGGVWSSSNTNIATVNASGVVTAVASGLATIQYAVTNPCGTTTVERDVTINSYCLNYYPIREGNYLYLQLHLLANGRAFKLGTGNLQFKYKTGVLSNPVLMSSPLTTTGTYSGVTFTTPNLIGIDASDGLGSLNFNFTSAAGNGILIPTTGNGQQMAVIRFSIANEMTPDFRTYENALRGILVYNDANELVQRGTCTESNYRYAMPIAMSYSSASYCASGLSQPIQMNLIGTYTSQPAGLTLNATTGVINPATSTPGTYQVYYNIPSSGGAQSMTTVVIKPLPTVQITQLTDAYCSSVAPFTLTGTHSNGNFPPDAPPTNGTFTVDGTPTSTFTPGALTTGTHQVTYSYTDAAGCTNTATQNVLINQAPHVAAGAASMAVCEGQPILLNASVTGTNLTFQWKKETTTLSGATTSTYTIPTASLDDAGDYTLEISGCAPTALTTTGTVVIQTAPSITTQPATTTACIGTPIALNVMATGTALTYQWKKGGVDIAGATAATYGLATATTADAGSYSVSIGGTCAPAAVSNAATVTVYTEPSITTQPIPTTTICAQAPFSLTVAATGTGLQYKWFQNGVEIPTETQPTLTIAHATSASAGNYTVVVSGSCGTPVTSEVAILNVQGLPTITTQPTTAPVCEGTAVALNVAATGTGLTYQWRKQGIDIASATSATYNITNPVAADAGIYTVVVNGTCAPAVTSTAAAVVVNVAPRITVQPDDYIPTCVGDAVQINVTATGTAVTYQWQKDGTPISGATNNRYDIAAITATDAGNYQVVVGNMCQSNLQSGVSEVVLRQLPAITTQPTATTTVCEGTAVELSVAATGTDLIYQWKKEGTIIIGANAITYRIDNPTATDAGVYTLQVSGVCAPSVTSTGSTVVVNIAPSITVQPNPSTICVGAPVSLSVTATGTALTYQWKKDGTAIPTATNATHTIPTSNSTDAGIYTVSIQNACQTATSDDAAVVVNDLPAITTQPIATTTLCEGSTLQLNVEATGANIIYQWQKNGVNITDATRSYLSFASATADDAGIYTVAVNGTCAPAVVSTNATVAVHAQPAITTQPVSMAVCNNTPLSLSVSAVGGGLTYQWKKDGNVLLGMNDAALLIANMATTDVGIYSVVVTGVCGMPIESNNATITANFLPTPITGDLTVIAGFTTVFSNTVLGGIWSSTNTAVATVNTNGTVTGMSVGTATIHYTLTNACGTNLVTKNITVLPNPVRVHLKVILEGAYESATGLMTAELHTNNLIPTTEPYTGMTGFTHRGGGGGESIPANSTVLTATNQDAIVDWVFVELRSKLTPSNVLYTRAALLQRDGDIVDVNGSTLTFLNVANDDYYVAVRHRNHLGFRTATAQALSSTAVNLDFTNNNLTTFGIEALKIVNGVSMMYSGEADGNAVINAADLNGVWLFENGNNGYKRSDFDLNGVVNAIDRNAFWRINNSRIEQLD